MRYFKSLVFLCAVLFGTTSLAQPSTQTTTRIRDATGATTYAGVQQFTLTWPSTDFGLQVLSGNYFWDGGNMRLWGGAQANSDVVPVTTYAPYTLSLNEFFNGTTWQRSTGEAWDNNMTASPVSLNTNAFNVFYNTSLTAGMRWYGETIDDSMTADPVAPWVSSYGIFGSLDSNISRRITGEAYDASMTAAPTNPNFNSFNVFWDSTNSINRRWLGESLDASNTAPVVAPYVGAITYGLDATGLVYYPLKTDANGVFVHQADLLPGEDAVNDYRKVKIQEVNPLTPGATSTAAVDNTGTMDILSSLEVIGYSQYTINVKNTGGVNTLDYVVLYASPNGTDWAVLDTYNTDIAPGGFARVVSVINNSDRYIKVLAATTANTTSVDCYITGRVSN